MKLIAQLNLMKKCVDAALEKYIIKKAYLEKETYSLLLSFDVPADLVSTPIPSSKLQSTDYMSYVQRAEPLLNNLLLHVMQRSNCIKRKCMYVSDE